MKRLTGFFAAFLLFYDYKVALAISSYTYQVIQESVSLFISLACLLLTISIFAALKGGSLSTPWLLFLIGFALAASAGAMHLLDLFKILIHVYDLRLANLLITCGSLISLLLGLWFYRKGLE